MSQNNTPLEDDECVFFSSWLKINHIPHAHVANESRSSSRAAMIRGAKLKKMGQCRGVWDYEVFVPQKDGSYKLAKIEMKRQKGGTVSEEQKEWGEIYKKTGIACKICKGADDAINFIKTLL